MERLYLPARAVAHLGGHASRGELLALGCDPTFIKLSLWYRTIVPTRRGWYASRETPLAVLHALRAGGRLACVSALAWHEGREVLGSVHVLVAYGVSRPRREGATLHWSRREQPGTRLVVDEEVARRQAATCRASR